MIDLYLKADDEAALIEALPFARFEGQWISATHNYALDVIGAIYTEATYDAQGEVINPPELIPGYHANLRCTPEIAALVPQDIIMQPGPSTPVRRWL